MKTSGDTMGNVPTGPPLLFGRFLKCLFSTMSPILFWLVDFSGRVSNTQKALTKRSPINPGVLAYEHMDIRK
jgi:hypothetical protein